MLHDPTFFATFLNVSISRTQSPRIRTITTNKMAAVQNWSGLSDCQKVAFILLLDQIEEDEGVERREKEVWTRKWLLTRDKKGACSQIVEELRVEDKPEYKKYFRMPTEKFNDLLEKIKGCLLKEDTLMRSAIKPKDLNWFLGSRCAKNWPWPCYRSQLSQNSSFCAKSF